MDKDEPIQTKKVFSLNKKEDVAKAMQGFQGLVFELLGKETFPCEVHVDVIFCKFVKFKNEHPERMKMPSITEGI